jgi:hypothetical protein
MVLGSLYVMLFLAGDYTFNKDRDQLIVFN